jgi:hypothetical protein
VKAELGGIMSRVVCCCALIALSTSSAFCAEQEPQWRIYASCAAAYQANWQNRLSDPSRKPEMSTMIQDEAEQYKLAAIGYYEKEKGAPKDEAHQSVDGYVKTIVERFIAMDKVGTLEAYIDKCPQPEDPN